MVMRAAHPGSTASVPILGPGGSLRRGQELGLGPHRPLGPWSMGVLSSPSLNDNLRKG